VRRPRGHAGFPRAHASPLPAAAVPVILLFAVALPTVGVSLLLVLLGEGAIKRVRARRLERAA